jgi:SpoVK/Ycf46/Vps4 family AAA+-type ATPase
LQANDATHLKASVMKTNRATVSNDAALNAFMQKKAQIDAMLERLKALSDDHFGTTPDAVNWADVGSLEFVEAQLRGIENFAFKDTDLAAFKGTACVTQPR